MAQLQSNIRGQRSPLPRLELVFWHGVLLGVAVTALIALYSILVAATRIYGLESGWSETDLARLGAWASAVFVIATIVPMLRFSIAELPSFLGDFMRMKPRDLVYVAVLIGAAALLFVL
jgi:hypothetical protein